MKHYQYQISRRNIPTELKRVLNCAIKISWERYKDRPRILTLSLKSYVIGITPPKHFCVFFAHAKKSAKFSKATAEIVTRPLHRNLQPQPDIGTVLPPSEWARLLSRCWTSDSRMVRFGTVCFGTLSHWISSVDSPQTVRSGVDSLRVPYLVSFHIT